MGLVILMELIEMKKCLDDYSKKVNDLWRLL